LKFLADENFDNDILRALRLKRNNVDVIRVQDISEILGADDPTVLEWAANENRILLTHDVQTMTKYAYERVTANQKMLGVFEVKRNATIGSIVDDLLLVIDYSDPEEWENQVKYLPFQ
jgi:hypothetical protein